MPKTKEQKRKEALERTRKLFESRMLWQMRHQRGGDIYEECAMYLSVARADEKASAAVKDFKKWCKSVGLDTSGNLV